MDKGEGKGTSLEGGEKLDTDMSLSIRDLKSANVTRREPAIVNMDYGLRRYSCICGSVCIVIGV